MESYVTHASAAGYALGPDEARYINIAFATYAATAPKLDTVKQVKIREEAFRHAATGKRNSLFGERLNTGKALASPSERAYIAGIRGDGLTRDLETEPGTSWAYGRGAAWGLRNREEVEMELCSATPILQKTALDGFDARMAEFIEQTKGVA